VDRCPDCHGVWLDGGEIEAMMQASERGFLSRALGDFMGSLKRKG
jgi:Zn-finger nucleic acid-binding protein